MTLSELLIKYRREHCLSQRQMAAQCNLSTGYISLIEKTINPQTGKAMIPTLTVLNKLAKGMGITIDNLFSICDDMPVSLSREEPAIASDDGQKKNIVKIAGRDGAYIEKRLSDSDIELLLQMIDRLPDASDDL